MSSPDPHRPEDFHDSFRRDEPGHLENEDDASVLSLALAEEFLVADDVGHSAAAAMLRGPPATRHFGGNRGGFFLNRYDRETRRRVLEYPRPIAICGTEKTVIYNIKKMPRGKVYQMGASGALSSDPGFEREYLCCFHVQKKTLLLYEVDEDDSLAIELEQPMKSKLNFWTVLPPQAHNNTLVIMLITPLGGFHWMPLALEPRPRRVWLRGQELQGKRILAYEEGGSNGYQERSPPRSTVALLLTPSSPSAPPSGTPCVDAWCIRLNRESTAVSVGTGVMGAALFRATESGADGSGFCPLLCTVGTDRSRTTFPIGGGMPGGGRGSDRNERETDEGGLVLQVSSLIDASAVAEAEGSSVVSAMSVVRGAVIARVTLDTILGFGNGTSYAGPELALGHAPEVLVLCRDNFIVVVFRSFGLILAYAYHDGTNTLDDDSLSLFGKKEVCGYVVDGVIYSCSGVEGEVEMNFLVYDESCAKPGGKIVTMVLSREGI
uniref:Uncharacterized protein n=1 Tax=Corethron hystrix TaxID=216773 RepID=A0A7S1BSR1_9STRA